MTPELPDLDTFEALARARRTNLLVDRDRPVPEELVARLCDLARWAPNHKRTWPWQFATFTGRGRERLGEAYAIEQLAAGERDEARLAKTRSKYLRAPLILLAGSAGHARADLQAENRDAVAAAIEIVLLAGTAAGLATFWSSPPVSPAPSVLALAGFEPGTDVVGVVYLGWPIGEAEVPDRPPVRIHHIGE